MQSNRIRRVKRLRNDRVRHLTRITRFQVVLKGRCACHATDAVVDEVLAGLAQSAMGKADAAKPIYKAPLARQDAGSAMA
jgi:hypothetical protein